MKTTTKQYIFYSVFTISFLLLIRCIFNFNGLFGQDSYDYVKIEKGLKNYFFQNIEIPYSVFPIGYSLTGFIFSLVIRNEILAMQLISMLSLILACIYLRKLINHIYTTDFKADLFIVLFFIFSPYVLRFGLLVMSDMLCISIFLIFLYHTLKFLRTPSLKDLLFLSFAAGFCIYIRYASGIVLIIPAGAVVLRIIKIRRFDYLLYPLVVLLLVSLPELLLRHRFLLWDINGREATLAYFYVPQQWSAINFFRRDFTNLDGVQHYSYPNILFAFQNLIHPAFIFTGALFLFSVKKQFLKKKEIQMLSAIILVYALFAAGYPYQSNRYLLFTFPLILLIYYPSFIRLYQWCGIPSYLKTTGIVCFVAVQFFLFLYSSQTIFEMNKNEKEIAEAIKNYPGKNIYTFSIDGALNTYGADYVFYDIYSNHFDTIKSNSLLLFNYDAFAKQFAGLNPMVNYNFITTHYRLTELETFASGWKLYAIE